MAQVSSQVLQLGVEPRKIEVVCTRDGHTYNHKDDGGASTRDGFIAHPFRQSLLRKAALRDKKGNPVWAVRTAIAPLFPGDPLASFPVIDAKLQAVIDANVAEKAEKLANDRLKLVNEAKALGANELVQKIVEQAVAAALKADAEAKRADAEDKKAKVKA